jgi:aquaporin Z
MGHRLTAEFLGTFWLVFGGCGSAVLSAAFPDVGIGLLGVSLAFGLTVLTMAYAVRHVSQLWLFWLAAALGAATAGLAYRALEEPRGAPQRKAQKR